MSSTGNIAIVVLAAGASRRFGSPKQLASYRGIPLLEHVLNNCSALSQTSQGMPTYVVLGANRQQIEAAVKLDNVRVLYNPAWETGIASSVRIAVQELASRFNALLLVAGDQPLVSTLQLSRMIERFHEDPEKIVAARYSDGPGIPALFPHRCNKKLLTLSGDTGAKSVLMEEGEEVVGVSIPTAALDIDTPDDLAAIIKN